MKWVRPVVTAIAALWLLTACDVISPQKEAPPVLSSAGATDLQAKQPGAALAKYGYTPLSSWYKTGQSTQAGTIYAVCGQLDVAACASDLRSVAAAKRPVLYVDNEGKIQLLRTRVEGSYPLEDRSYYAACPDGYQDFAALDLLQQPDFLNLFMPQVVEKYLALAGSPKAARLDVAGFGLVGVELKV